MITIMLLFCLLLSSCSAITSKLQPHWKDLDVETIFSKDLTPLYEERAIVSLLRKLKQNNHIVKKIFNEEMSISIEEITSFLGGTVHNETDFDEVMKIFLSAKGKQTKGIFSMLNICILIGIVVTLIGGGMVFGEYIVKLLISLSSSTRIILAYAAALAVVRFAWYIKTTSIRPYIALFGAMTLASAYLYHLSQIKNPHSKTPEYILISPVFAAWLFLTWLFTQKMIGFLTVGALQGMLGFLMYTGPLSYSFGFKGDNAILVSLWSSIIMVGLYIIYLLNRDMLDEWAFIELFEPGILFLSTFTGYLALLILSSRYYRSESYRSTTRSSYLFYNVVALGVGISSFYFGALFPALSLFRGVASTFLVFFLLGKWGELSYDTPAIGTFVINTSHYPWHFHGILLSVL